MYAMGEMRQGERRTCPYGEVSGDLEREGREDQEEGQPRLGGMVEDSSVLIRMRAVVIGWWVVSGSRKREERDTHRRGRVRVMDGLIQ